MLIRGSDACHWYDKNGNPVFEILGKNGKMVKTTVVSARNLGLLPSVTTVLKILNKPELERWKQEQILLAGLRTQKTDGESEKDYISRIIEASQEGSNNAIDFGLAVHEYCKLKARSKDIPQEVEAAIPSETRQAIDIFLSSFDEILLTEGSLANDTYAGTVDMVGRRGDRILLIDYKTQRTTVDKPATKYNEWLYQLVAYRDLIKHTFKYEHVEVANLAISSTEKGRIEIVDYYADDENSASRVWGLLLDLFYAIKGLGGIKSE